MEGVKKMMSEFYSDAVHVLRNGNMPPWVSHVSIRKEDQAKFPGTDSEKFFSGARLFLTTQDGEEYVLVRDVCLQRLIHHIDHPLLMRFVCGSFDEKDCDSLVQIADFGTVKYPPEGRVNHHDLRIEQDGDICLLSQQSRGS